MTRKERKEKMRAIKNKHLPGTRLEGDEFIFAMSVLRENPDFEMKVTHILNAGSKVVIGVEKALYGTTCFCLESEDGLISIPISFYWTDNKTMSARQQISNALREADSSRVAEFRRKVPDEFVCPFTGITVRPHLGDDFDVDHYDKCVAEIADDIIKAKGEEVIMKYITQGFGGGCVFTEPLRSRLKSYMASASKLRYASSAGNRSDGSKHKL